MAAIVLLVSAPALPKSAKAKTAQPMQVPELLLSGGRRLAFERTLSSEREVQPKRGFWKKLVDVIAGQPDFHELVRPYSVVTDSRGRIIVSDPGAAGVHIFDFEQQKYKFLYHEGRDSLLAPQCLTIDKRDNIYVTDSKSGKIFVFDSAGKFRHTLGSIKGGEGFFKRPTGIAVDADAERIYVSDTLRNKIFVLDMSGAVIQTIGQSGQANGEFNYPTELRLAGDDLIVVDAMNFRVQVLSRSGAFKYSIGAIGDGYGDLFRPKGVGVDSEGHFYVVDGLASVVQVFDRQGRLLYYFGQKGTGLGDFELPSGLWIDAQDRIFVADSYNRRVQVFRYFAGKQSDGVGR